MGTWFVIQTDCPKEGENPLHHNHIHNVPPCLRAYLCSKAAENLASKTFWLFTLEHRVLAKGEGGGGEGKERRLQQAEKADVIRWRSAVCTYRWGACIPSLNKVTQQCANNKKSLYAMTSPRNVLAAEVHTNRHTTQTNKALGFCKPRLVHLLWPALWHCHRDVAEQIMKQTVCQTWDDF